MTIRVSRGRSLLVALLAAGGIRAIALCELPAPLLVTAAFAVAVLAAHELARPRVTSLAVDRSGLWELGWSSGERFTGRLVETGYRGAALLVLVFERDAVTSSAARERGGRTGPESPAGTGGGWAGSAGGLLGRRLRPGRRRRVAVFADSVEARDFSFLHLELAFVGRAG